MTCRRAVPLVLAVTLELSARAAAQGIPIGTIRGQVVDPASLPLPGVTITATSPVLPGKQTTVTSTHGDFILPFLPPGEYAIVFEHQGFQRQTHIVTVVTAETRPLIVTLAIAPLADVVRVSQAQPKEIATTLTVAHTYQAGMLEHLPVGRTLNDAVLLAPGVTPNGPNGRIVISGALAHENLYSADGVVINGGVVAAPLPLYIEDAIQETTTATGNISAEYGRFRGGVVTMVTKSGGNAFSGSFRTSFANDAWRALTPDPNDHREDRITPAFELTLGGPVRRDKTWFFGAARSGDVRRTMTTAFTGVSYPAATRDTRGEVKVIQTWNARHTLRGSWVGRTLPLSNNNFGKVMDLASLYDERTDFASSAVNYTGVLTSRLFVEGQYSRKTETNRNRGAKFADPLKGTPILDGSRGGARFNSPPFCNVCGEGWLERNDNWNWFAKLTYFLSTRNTGSHNLVAGVDTFEETRQNDNWQSGSGYEVQATATRIEGSTIFPVFKSGTIIRYLPLVAESVGNQIRTYSAFANDVWQYGRHLTMNVGYRLDANRSNDQTGVPVVHDTAFSPRVSVSWDITGNGAWTLSGGLARYVAGMNTLLVDAASPGGRTASYSYSYDGPEINAGSPPFSTAEDALTRLFGWFFANGGLKRNTRSAPVIPGTTRKIDRGLEASSADERSVGIAHQLGRRGAWRIDYLSRDYRRMYGDFINADTGRVRDAEDREYDFAIVNNNRDARRSYQGITASLSQRWATSQIGANYTLSWSRGNVDGEGPNTSFYRTGVGTYPEYREARWNWPMGYTASDQRHKLRAWMWFPIPRAKPLGEFSLSILQRFDSGLPYDAVGPVDPLPWVTGAPDYKTPPASVSYYFSRRFGLRWGDAWNTDIAVLWSTNPARIPAQVFFRAVITNVFNNAALVSGDSTVLTAVSQGTRTDLRVFDPFHDTPLFGVNWTHGPDFGKPTGPTSYQTPRTFRCSAGVRF